MATYEYTVDLLGRLDDSQIVQRLGELTKEQTIKITCDAKDIKNAANEIRRLTENTKANILLNFDESKIKQSLQNLESLGGKTAEKIGTQFKTQVTQAFNARSGNKVLTDYFNGGKIDASSIKAKIKEFQSELSSYKFDKTDFLGMEKQAARFKEFQNFLSLVKQEINSINGLSMGDIAGMSGMSTIKEVNQEYDVFVRMVASAISNSENFANAQSNLTGILESNRSEFANLVESMSEMNRVTVGGHGSQLDLSTWKQLTKALQDYKREIGDIISIREKTQYKNGMPVGSTYNITGTKGSAVLGSDFSIKSMNGTVVDKSQMAQYKKDLKNLEDIVQKIEVLQGKIKAANITNGTQGATSGLQAQLKNAQAEQQQLEKNLEALEQNIFAEERLAAVQKERYDMVQTAQARGVARADEIVKAAQDKVQSKEYRNALATYNNAVTNGNTQVQKLEGTIAKYDGAERAAQQVQALKQALFELQGAGTGSMDGLIAASDKYEAALQEVINRTEVLKSTNATLDERTGLLSQMEMFWANNSRAHGVFGDQFKQLAKDVASSEGTIDSFTSRWNAMKAAIASSGKLGLTFFDRLKQSVRSVGAYASIYLSFYQIVNIFKKGISQVKELDVALTEMRKVSDESYQSLKRYQDLTFNISDEIGTTALQLQQSTADWMRLGESLTDAQESAKVSNILFNVSEFESIDEATTSLVAMASAYKDLDKIEIVDKLNNIGNNFSISTDGLAEALQRSAAALSIQGNSIDSAIALITAGNAINQDPQKVGNGIRTIALRMAGTEEAKKELEESGEEVTDYIIDGVVGTKSKINQQLKEFTAVASNNYEGVSMVDERGNYKDTYEVMQDIADIYDEIVATDKKFGTNHLQALLELLAGKNRANIAASILQNGDMLRDVYESSQDSEGSAEEENEKYLDSIEGKIKQLQNNLQNLAYNIFNSDALKKFLDGLNAIFNAINNIVEAVGPIPSLMAAAFGVSKLSGWLKGNSTKSVMKEYINLVNQQKFAEFGINSEDTASEAELATSKEATAVASEQETAAIVADTEAKMANVAANKALAESEVELTAAQARQTTVDVADTVDDAVDVGVAGAETVALSGVALTGGRISRKKNRKAKRYKRRLKQGKSIPEGATTGATTSATTGAGAAIGNEIAEDVTKNASEPITNAVEKTVVEAEKDGLQAAATTAAGDAAGMAGGTALANGMKDGLKKTGKEIEKETEKQVGDALKNGAKGAEKEGAKGIGSIFGNISASLAGSGMVGALTVGLPIAAMLAAAAYGNWKSKDFTRKYNASTDSQAKYDEIVTNLDSVNSKLTENQDKIREIEAMPSKSITDEADLARLERENAALERQKALLEAQEKTQKQQKNTDALLALGSKEVKGGTEDELGVYRIGIGTKTQTKGTITDVTEKEIDEWIRLQETIKKKGAEFLRLEKDERVGEKGQRIQESIAKLEEEMNSLDSDYIQSHIAQLTDLQNSLDTSTEEGLKQYNLIDDIIHKYTDYGLSRAEKASTSLTDFFGGSADENIASIGKSLKQSIIDQLSSGEAKTAEEALNNLGLTISSIGDDVDAKSLNDYFGNIVAGAKMAKDSVDSMNGSFEGVKSAFETANQGADFDEMAGFLKTAQELRKNGQIGTDDFKTIAQWMSPKEIKGDAKEYRKAYDKYQKKVNSWFNVTDKDGNVDVKKGVTNFADALTGAGLGKRKGSLDTLKLNFDNTAQAAEKLGVSVGVVDVALHKLEEYGVDLGEINFSSELLNEYSDSLEELKTTYNSMSEGKAKESLGKKIFGDPDEGIKGFQKWYEYYQSHMGKLTEDQIVKIKLEVDSAQLESEIENLRGDGRTLTAEERGAVISKEVELRRNREKATGINKKNNKDYASSYKQLDQLHDMMNDPKNADNLETLQKYEDGIIHLQNTWLDMQDEGKNISWGEFLQTDEAEKELDGLSSLLDKDVKKVIDVLTGEYETSLTKAEKKREEFTKKDADYRHSHKKEAKKIVKGLKADGYENAGINKRGRPVKDVEESNKNIDKYTNNLFDKLEEGKDVYKDLEKEAKRQGYVSDEQGSAVEKLAKEYDGGTKSLKKYKKALEETNKAESKKKKKKKDKDKPEDRGKGKGKSKEETGTTTKNTEVTEKTTKNKEETEKITTETTKIDFEVDTSEVENLDDDLGLDETMQKVVEIVGEDKATPLIALWNTLQADPKFASLSAKDQALWVINAWNNLTPEEKEAIVNGVDNATGTLEKIDNKQIEDKSVVVKVLDYASSIIQNIKDKLTNLDGKKATTTIETKKVTTVEKIFNNGKKPEGGSNVELQGSAYAKGTLSDEKVNDVVRSDSWKTNRSETALTGEVGQELVVSGNRWFTVGDNGAEFVHIPKGAVVFNAEQTEQLFKKGYINSRGKSNGKVKYPSSSASYIKGTANKSGTAYKKGSSSTLADKISNYTSQLFDWAELRLKRLSRVTEKYNKIAEKSNKLSEKSYKQTLVTYKQKVKGKTKTRKVTTVNMGMQQAANAEIDAVRDEIIGNDKASRKYRSTANKVAKKGKLSKKLKKQIRNETTAGTFNIKRYKKATKNKATLEAIEAYNEWYEKYLDTQDTIADLEQKMKEAYQKRLDNIEEWYSTISDYRDAYNDRNKSRREFYDSIGNSYGAEEYTQSITNAKNNITTAYDAYYAYKKEFEKQVKNGIIKANTTEWYKGKEELANLSKTYWESRSALEELNKEVRSITFDNLKNSIDLLETSVDKLSTQFELMEKIGVRNSDDIGYANDKELKEAQLNNAKSRITSLKSEIDYWLQYREEALSDMSSVEINTPAWKEAKERYDDANSSILDTTSNILDLEESIREIRWKSFEDGIAVLENTDTELNNIKDALNDKYLRDDNGALTNNGLAMLGVLSQQLDNTKKKIVAYNQALIDLNDDYKNNNISLGEYLETKREYQNITQELAVDEKEYIEDIVDVYTESIEQQNDILQENIEKRKDALSKVKDYYDYQRTISEKSKDINYLQQQIAALEGVSNKAGQAKLASLREQLAEAQLDMNDTVYEHEYELRMEGYDNLADELDKHLEEIEKKISESEEYQQKILGEALELVKQKTGEVSEFIINKLNNSGVQVSDETKNILSDISGTKEELKDVSSIVNDLSTATSELVESLTGISDIDTSGIDAIDESLQKAVDTASSTGQDKTSGKVDLTKDNGASTGAGGTSSSNKSATKTTAKTTTKTTKTTSYTKEQKANYKTRIDGYLARNGKKYNKTTKYGELNTALGKKTGFVLDEKHRKDLAKHLGTTEKNLYKFLQDIGYLPRKTTVSGKFAKGTKKVPKDMLGITQDAGQEVIYRKSDGAMLTPLGKGDKVFTAQMTDNLWKLAQNASLNNNGLSNLSAPIINNINTSSPTININFENFMTVQGNVDKEAITDIKKFKSEMVDEFTKTMTNEMNLLGHKFRF